MKKLISAIVVALSLALPLQVAAESESFAKDSGLDIAQLRRDMDTQEIDAHIQTSRRLPQTLGITGTPSFVIGDTLVPSVVGMENLQKLIADALEPEQ